MDTATTNRPEHVETVVIGAGQAGLATGHELGTREREFVILDGHGRVGDPWRERWDSLRLFTPARFNGLPGLPFPAAQHVFPTKDEMGDYLERYAAHFDLPVRTGVRVERVAHDGQRFTLTTSAGSMTADNVVVAMGNYQRPRVPGWAPKLDSGIVQLHSHAYRSPDQLQAGPVLLVGAGNSAAEIAMEISRTHPTFMAGRDVGHMPFRIGGFLGRHLLVRLVLRVLFHRVLTVHTPLGRKVRSKVLTQGGPLIRTKPKDLAAARVERVARVDGVRDGLPVLVDGRVLDVANVIWCTGFTGGFDWIDLPVLDGPEPVHDRGVVASVPGLYFVGLHFQTSMSSAMVHGVGRDAEYVARHLDERTPRPARSGQLLGGTVAGWLPQRLGL